MSIAATVGRPIVTAIPACIHDGFVALEDLKGVDQTYLLYSLKALEGELTLAGQTGSQTNVNTDIVKALTIPVPPEPEQRAIADALRDTDRSIAALERLIVKKQAIRLGMMQQLLFGRSRLPRFSDSWGGTTIGALGLFLKGRGIKREDVRSSGVRCIRYGELYTAFNDYTSQVRSFVSSTVAATALPLKSGDLLFAGSGETREEIGKCVAYMGPTPAVAGGDVIVLRSDRCNAVYLAMLVNLPEVARQRARVGQGDVVVHIYSRALAEIEVTLPPREEQDAIAQVIVDANHEIEALGKRLAKTKDIKQGMMQELLTGRTRLPAFEAVA